MSDFYIGQIMMTGFGFPPKYFAQCNGQILGIAQNNALFALLGTTYGGDGRTTFALPDLRSRTPAGGLQSQSGGWNPTPYAMGQVGGAENVNLLGTQMPMHTHQVVATTAAATGRPSGRAPGLTLATAEPTTYTPYGPATALEPLALTTVLPTGGNQAHPNIQPYQAINFNIALNGLFPSRN